MSQRGSAERSEGGCGSIMRGARIRGVAMHFSGDAASFHLAFVTLAATLRPHDFDY
jgi:hypothetical protein